MAIKIKQGPPQPVIIEMPEPIARDLYAMLGALSEATAVELVSTGGRKLLSTSSFHSDIYDALSDHFGPLP